LLNSIYKIYNRLATGKIQTEPCLPGPFGYKTAWYAIKGETPQAVMQKLGLNELCVANWESGIGYVYANEGDVFVTPEIDGYVLVIGLPRDINFSQQHGGLFDELQHFVSNSVWDYYAWAKFTNGTLVRTYCACAETGEVTSDGEITTQELQLGLDNLPPIAGGLEGNSEHAYEQAVLLLAKAWGIDTLFPDEQRYDKSAGWLCRFK